MIEAVIVLCTRAHIEQGPALDVRMVPRGRGMMECPTCGNRVQIIQALAEAHRSVVPFDDPLGLSQTRP